MANEQKKILVIEDEKPMARALELKLTHEGYLVKAVFDGMEGLAEIEKGAFDLIIMDLVMPKADGFDVLQGIKEKQVNVPVVVLSNLSQAEDEKKAKEMGAKDFFIKSNTPLTDIVAYVKKTLA